MTASVVDATFRSRIDLKFTRAARLVRVAESSPYKIIKS